MPKSTNIALPISLGAAQKLAYYSAFGEEVSVLAPRGWYCFGTYGSGGSALLVSPKPIDTAGTFSTWDGLAGPAIAVSNRNGGTSGRFDVAEIVARVFPAYKTFATGVMEEFPGVRTFEFSPYPKDALTYKSKSVVEYKTPAQADGLGTRWLKRNGSPIEGVALLTGETPDLTLLSVRLPPGMNGLTSVIVRQIERHAEPGYRH